MLELCCPCPFGAKELYRNIGVPGQALGSRTWVAHPNAYRAATANRQTGQQILIQNDAALELSNIVAGDRVHVISIELTDEIPIQIEEPLRHCTSDSLPSPGKYKFHDLPFCVLHS